MEEIKPSRVFKNDPIFFKSLIGKTVEVEMINNKTYVGFVYCIDPVTENIVLVNKASETHYDTDLLLGQCVKNINVISEDICDDKIFQFKTETDHPDLDKKRKNLKEWLTNHFIDVAEDGEELKIGDDLVISPPYTINDCVSSNTIILERIRTILVTLKDDNV